MKTLLNPIKFGEFQKSSHKKPRSGEVSRLLEWESPSFMKGRIQTQLLKLITDTNRPNGGTESFPSGHTSSAFATSATLMDMYGPAVGVPMLAISTFAGLSRLASTEHWLSDVIFGATLGYIVGHSYTIHHQKKSSDLELTLFPFYDSRKSYGVAALIKF